MTIHYDDKGKFFTDVITKIPVPSVIQTLTHRVHGSIHIRQDERLADALNRPAEFLAITNAEIYNARGDVLFKTNFIAIYREHVVWIVPDDEFQREEEEIE